MHSEDKPRETLSVVDAVAIVVGMVVGVGIFKTPSLVAANAESEGMVLTFWLLGGAASLAGVFCYAELMSAFPHPGGDYHYLNRAFGVVPAFLYAWARMAVIQTGSIAMVAFLAGDYASEMIRLGPYSASVYAALAVIGLTLLNIAGIRQGKTTQKALVAVILLGLLLISAFGILNAPSRTFSAADQIVPGKQALGAAMIFVLLTYGGWNEASFLSAEVRAGSRNLLKVLLCSIGVVTLLYLLVNAALLKSLGLRSVAASGAVMTEMAGKLCGPGAGLLISVLILFAALSTMNSAIMTGARTCYALGRDVPILKFLGRWQGQRQTPVNALLVQGCIALVLVVWGAGAHDGFVMMVEYTAPVFWLFFLMVGLSVFILRRRYPDERRPFRVPIYPLTPLLFCCVCLFMLYASLAYTGRGSLLGACVLLSGIPFLILQKKRRKEDKQNVSDIRG